MWIITPHAWYNVAGPLHRQRPHAAYAPTFLPTRLKFEACAWVARLMEERRAADPTYKQVAELVAKATSGSEFEVGGMTTTFSISTSTY
jgi:hypothetical protein